MVIAFQIMMLLVLFLTVVALFAANIDKGIKIQFTSIAIASIISFLITLIWI
ncbi:hypothetical protein [Bacillus sp. FSL K6-3431]|uniref:hypothetical protein n=1 Tax=Bacillus sp. FSL K6-3431 TaxID=2921500 RepID=UPI0030FAFEAF